jgi:hypothetical protein
MLQRILRLNGRPDSSSEKEVELASVGRRHTAIPFGGVGKAVAWNDQTVVTRLEVAPVEVDEAGGWIQHRSFRRIVGRHVEDGHVTPQTVIRLGD